MIETNVYCDKCSGRYNRMPLREDEIVCTDCYDLVVSERDDMESENSQLKEHIEKLLEENSQLEYYKEIVMNNPELAKIVVADKL